MKIPIQLGLVIALIFSVPDTLEAQLTPYFEMSLYFEDAIGNRDTVIFGYDINASSDIDPEWGEVELTTPFDSVFEVKIGSFDYFYKNKLTKRLIQDTEIVVNDSSCYIGSTGIIYVYAIHYPIKVNWDKNLLLNNECFRGAFIVNHITDELAGPISPDEIPPLYYCMAAVDSGYFDFTEEPSPEQIRVYINKEVEGLGIMPIPGLRLIVNPYWAYTPCYWVTETENTRYVDGIAIYPNPVSGYFKLSDLSGGGITGPLFIYNSTGQMVKHHTAVGLEQVIDVSGLSEGRYHVVVYMEKNRIWRGAFVKQ
ncbi:MAG: T9SS type A sorting domain-containing protein [Saprospiraceae bacterium]|jgi:hypothetical protein|nr:T9SS type A sorting domain-containing protein [Saprospiraceae bacterium]